MKIFAQIDQLKAFLKEENQTKLIGFVPTMGALHEGHLKLVEKSIQENDLTVCSIFVNKIQFNNEEDFAKYPNTLEEDIQLLESIGCNCLFAPDHSTIYPEGYRLKEYSLGDIEYVLEGSYRPGHFQGVCNVVNRLLGIIQPDRLYLGLKDFQQCKVIEKMTQLVCLERKLELKFCETIRNNDGLALSSRNKRLSVEGINKATILIKILNQAREKILAAKESIDLTLLGQESIKKILNSGFDSVDYFAFVNEHFEVIDLTSNKNKPSTILTAGTIEGVRLIDNIKI
ncbi:pantoate--beta-alanine ligase [Sediminibacterium sp.]|uniref:pantoate--beta-alanine ligase n=1 Tax=Sediminibacterium sp. TaxID=1917865 RepID=UPI002732AA89|nr:pantoate--beta-alanine ligase [Sediminibacterium sp.]MDP3392977.1 pantoate--beta-alanine ligase [Sediminibacterium sp.]MDP3567183.1 pantoate--beta-alanine ligase [Sediminibacterium sp.]